MGEASLRFLIIVEMIPDFVSLIGIAYRKGRKAHIR